LGDNTIHGSNSVDGFYDREEFNNTFPQRNLSKILCNSLRFMDAEVLIVNRSNGIIGAALIHEIAAHQIVVNLNYDNEGRHANETEPIQTVIQKLEGWLDSLHWSDS
jgi:hypothetical protein